MTPNLRRNLLLVVVFRVYFSCVTVSRVPVHDGSKEKWGDFANVGKMSKFIEEQHLDLELVDKQEPVDYSGDVDGRMFVLVFKKKKRTARKPITWLLQRAEDFKQAGNSYYSNPAKRKHPEQVVCSNPRVQVLWKAVACYVQGLDCLTMVRSALYEQEHDMASETATERERQLKLLSSRHLDQMLLYSDRNIVRLFTLLGCLLLRCLYTLCMLRISVPA